MATSLLARAMPHLHALAEIHRLNELNDAQLVDRFRRFRCPIAFEAIWHRHGALVRNVCRRLLADRHSADDAFQATFVILLRKIDTVSADPSLAGWLSTVARRVALRVLRQTQQRNLSGAGGCSSRDPLEQISGRELCRLLDEELQRLPERYRLPLELCCLVGRTRDEAARQLGWTVQVLKGRLERGRTALRRRLTSRGLSLPAALAAASLIADDALAVPRLVANVPDRIETICLGVIRAMRFAKLEYLSKAAIGLLFAVSTALILAGAAGQPPADAPKAVPAVDEKPLMPPSAVSPIAGDWNPASTGLFSFFPSDQWTVTGKTIVANPGNNQETFAYKFNATTLPPSIDLIPQDGPNKGKIFPGIFSRDSDYLEICYDDRPGAKRPKAFVANSDLGGNHSLLFVDAKIIVGLSPAARVRVNLKILGLALHGYVQMNGHLPPAYLADPTGVPLSSWRVQICPFMQQLNVFKAFHQDEAWDSPNNAPVRQVNIKAFTAPIPQPVAQHTLYQAFVGKGTLFTGKEAQKLPAAEALATTVMLVEANVGVPWTKPDDIRYFADLPLPVFGASVPGSFHVLLADGSVKLVKGEFDETVFRQLVLREKAKPVRWDDLIKK